MHLPVSTCRLDGGLMDLSDIDAQKVLNGGVSIVGHKQVYGYKDGRLYKFQPDNLGGWHGYIAPSVEVPAQALREMRDAKIITNAEYKKYSKGK